MQDLFGCILMKVKATRNKGIKVTRKLQKRGHSSLINSCRASWKYIATKFSAQQATKRVLDVQDSRASLKRPSQLLKGNLVNVNKTVLFSPFGQTSKGLRRDFLFGY